MGGVPNNPGGSQIVRGGLNDPKGGSPITLGGSLITKRVPKSMGSPNLGGS